MTQNTRCKTSKYCIIDKCCLLKQVRTHSCAREKKVRNILTRDIKTKTTKHTNFIGINITIVVLFKVTNSNLLSVLDRICTAVEKTRRCKYGYHCKAFNTSVIECRTNCSDNPTFCGKHGTCYTDIRDDNLKCR